ncbi:TonB-dependent receptor [Oligoflexia bacterium]|nr:TonB-dependent receptor [Oligoflexia bacterium]
MATFLLKKVRTLFSFLICVYIFSGLGLAAEEPQEFLDLDLETLLEMEVSIASKKPQKLSDVAAAVHVITQEDIRRSGATSIPEALRMVPGIHVARVNSRYWAISARGFNSIFANKLLVLIDGRSVYTPLFAGVFWDVQDTLLEDVDRIEVIRGPGASVWGANAVNGVINVITKNAKDTHGTLLSGGGGTEERGFGAARYGGQVGEDTSYRLYSKYFSRDDSARINEDDSYDGLEYFRGGFRIDSTGESKNHLTLQGDIYSGNLAGELELPGGTSSGTSFATDNLQKSGGNVLARWDRELSNESDVVLQLYYDRTNLEEVVLDESRDTIDLDFQHRFKLFERQEINWGFGYRWTSDEVVGTEVVKLVPPTREDNLVTGFVQDEIALYKHQLRLTLGTKLEENDYTGFEIQPTARLLWHFQERQSLWTSFSRAVRTPSRVDHDIVIDFFETPNPDGSTTTLRGIGDEAYGSEELLAYEAGYRYRWDNAHLDVTGFYNLYDGIRTNEPGMPFVDPASPSRIIVPALFANTATADVYGSELLAEWQLLDWWKIIGSYSYLHMNFHMNAGSGDLITEGEEDQGSEHQLYFRSLCDLPYGFEVDTMLRYLGSVSNLEIDPYWEMDLRLGWKMDENLEFSVIGQNLFHSQHAEFVADSVAFTPAELERGVYGKLTWRFK